MARATASIQLSDMSNRAGETQIRQRHPYERFEEEGPPEDDDDGWNTEDERAALLQRSPHPQHIQDRERERLKQSQAELAQFRARFGQNEPSNWLRAGVLVILVGLVWLAFHLHFNFDGEHVYIA